MNKNILIVLAGAVLVAVLVAVLMQAMLGGSEPVQEVAEVPKVEILVASKNLKIGGELKDGDLRWQEWPKSSVFPGAVKRVDDQAASKALEGRLARDVSEGEPVMKTALLAAAKGNFVAASLDPGMRAIAIDVKAANMVAGFIGPGDFVDVILTYKETVKADKDDDPRIKNMVTLSLGKLATETILQNIQVLAIDQSAERPEDDKIVVGKTVTLAVGIEDAERIALAAELGDLSLSLRGVGDDVVFEKKWKTISDARLTNVADEIFDEYQKMKKDTSITPDIVRIYNGSEVQIVPAK